MDEYDKKIKVIEKRSSSIDQFKNEIQKLSITLRQQKNTEFVNRVEYELKILSLIERNSIVVDSNQKYLIKNDNNIGLSELEKDDIEHEQLEYYKKRMNTTDIDFLAYLYSNFLYDYFDKSIGISKFAIVRVLVLSVKEQLNNNNFSTRAQNILLARSLQVSLRMNYIENIKWLSKEIYSRIVSIRFDEEFKLTDLLILIELLGYISDLRNNIHLSSDKHNKILEIIDKEIAKTNDNKNYEAFRRILECKLSFLMTKKKDCEELDKIRNKIGQSYIDQGNSLEKKIEKPQFFEHALEYFKIIGNHEKIEESKIALSKAYRELNNSNELELHRYNISLPDEKRKAIDKTIKDITSLKTEDMLKSLAWQNEFIPNKSELMKQAKDDSSQKNLFSQISKEIIEDNRRIKLYVEPKQQLEYMFNMLYSYNLNFLIVVFLRGIFDCKIKKNELNSNNIMNFLRQRPFFDNKNLPIIEVGLNDFFKGDTISSIHILAPQLESAIRKMFEKFGFSTTSLSSDNSQNEQTFNAFLNRDDIKKALGEDIHELICFTMVDKAGFNLRNEIGHGLMTVDRMNSDNCILLIFLYLVITRYTVE